MTVHSDERPWTEQEYLDRERVAEAKSEYLAGGTYAMAGASPQHVTVCANLVRRTLEALDGRDCHVFGSDLRVKSETASFYSYPDVTIACGTLEFDDAHGDTLTNPGVLIEVLSPTSEAYDRGRKFELYMRIASLQQYVLVAQDRAHVDVFTRHAEGWILRSAEGLDAALELTSLGISIPLAQIYARVEFQPAP